MVTKEQAQNAVLPNKLRYTPHQLPSNNGQKQQQDVAILSSQKHFVPVLIQMLRLDHSLH